MDGAMSDARARRKAHADAEQPGGLAKAWKRYKIHAAIIGIWLVAVGGVTANAYVGEECPGHWHSTMDVFVNGDKVNFAHPAWTLEGQQGMPMSSHMHRNSDGLWHWEPPLTECQSLADVQHYVDMDLSSNALILDGNHAALGQDGTFRANDTHDIVAYRQTWEDEWKEVSVSKAIKEQAPDGARYIFAYGTTEDTAMGDLTPQATQIPAGQQPQSGGRSFPTLPVVMITLIAGGILAGWNSMVKKAY